ncbi:MAG TPA: hypothetical protein VGM98_06000 [Schlesneria sp.]
MATVIRLMIATCSVLVIGLISKDLGGVAISGFALWILYSAGADSRRTTSSRGRLTLSGRHV